MRYDYAYYTVYKNNKKRRGAHAASITSNLYLNSDEGANTDDESSYEIELRSTIEKYFDKRGVA